MMPGKDGITLCKELKSQVTTSHIPIILLTAKTSSISEIEGLKMGLMIILLSHLTARLLKLEFLVY
jgi:DNA-binding response OmpR family regulator